MLPCESHQCLTLAAEFDTMPWPRFKGGRLAPSYQDDLWRPLLVRKELTLLLVLALGTLLSGCSSIGARFYNGDPPQVDYGGVYPGIRFSWDFFFAPVKLPDGTERYYSVAKASGAAGGPLVICGIVDCPISLAFDTVLLPFDLVAYLTKPAMDHKP